MPGPIHHTAASEVKTAHGQTEGMVRQSAITNLSDKLCGLVMRAEPKTSSAVHHHGSQDTIVYVVSGHGALLWEDGSQRTPLNPGDWAYIPAGKEHQEVNDGDEELILSIVRSGSVPETVNLTGWRGQIVP